MTEQPDRQHIPVLIVGAGPSGSTSSLLLGKMGIPSVVLSKHRGTANTPRAHIFNQRAMEVLRDAGLEPQLEKLASSAEHMMHTSWLSSLSGEEYARIYAWGNKPSLKSVYELSSPCVMSDLPQSELEPVLVAEAQRVGAVYRFGHIFESLREDNGIVTCTIRDRESDKTYEITADYVIGADGGRSGVLDALGIEVIGQQLNNAFNVHIEADLTKYIAHRPGSLNWVLNNEAADWSAVANFRMVKPWTEFVVSMHPSLKDGTTFDPSDSDILRRLHQLIGDASLDKDEQVKITILSAYRWTINDQHSLLWQKGRVLCIGDAVHRHPPINGLGSNTCIGDAFNLSWKLAYVIRGLASPSILDTLTQERAPVGKAIVARANAGMRDHRALWAILGLTAEERQKVMSTMAEASESGRAMREKVTAAFLKTEDEVSSPGIQMNQIYAGTGSRLIASTPTNGALEEADQPPAEIPLKRVIISTKPGYHLPHVWLARNGQSPRVSSLDLCGKGKFTLLTGIGGDGWKAAVKSLAAKDFPITCYSVGFRQDYSDIYTDWSSVREVNDDGAILVRPDHFVAWRSQSMVQDPAQALANALGSLLGVPV